MAKLTIIGNPNPVVGKKEMYTISTINDYFQQIIPTQPLLNPQTPIHWGIFVQEKNTWRRTTDNKEGQAVPYTFGQKSLHFKAIKIVAQQGNESGELIIHPQQAKEPKITKVELLDANYLPLPKGKKISYQDTIIARAHCIEMYKRNVSFTLWEDDAKGEGHDPVINMMNKINPVPIMGIVDEYGIAEAVFRLPFYTMAVQIANARIAAGETDEGPTHEYYVTAEYVAKSIMKASPNVNVINPTYIPPMPPSKTSSNTPETKPSKPKPKVDTPKFPITSNGKKQADPDAKILNAEFLNERAQPIEKAEVGDTVIIKITTQHMKGRNVTVRIWEEETGYKTHDKIYEKKWVLPGNENFIKVPITKKIYELGITPEDMANEKYDYKFQVYFIEVEPDNTHVTSQVIPITKSAKKLEVENSRSVSIIKKVKEEKEDKVCEYEARVRAFIRMVRIGEGTGELIKSTDKEKKIIYLSHDFQKGYTTAFNNNKITDLSTHPQKNYGGSTAAGAYQIMGYTFKNYNGWYESIPESRVFDKYITEKDYAKKYSIKSFDAESQDKYCVAMMKHHPGCSNFITEIINNKIESAISNYGSRIWASLPEKGSFSRYLYKGNPQPVTPIQTCLEHYNKFLKDELADISNLHLKKGFLKEFGYNCCEEPTKKESLPIDNGKWRNPIDNPMLCLYSQGGAHKPWHGSFGEKIRDNSANHTGNDLLAIPGTNVYACVRSIIHKIYTSGSMAGNVVVLKVLDTETFKKLKRKEYAPKYKSKGEILERGFNENGTIYLTFWHLSKNNLFKEGDEVKHNDVIGLTGISGWNGKNFTTRNPHLHFEVSNVGSAPGLKGKCNPSVYFKFKTEDELSKSEIEFQNKLKGKEWK